MSKRDVRSEKSAVQVGKASGAVSSHRALFYHLVSPETIRRLALRKTDGAMKYGSVQWRRGINDVDFVIDRFNHLWEHLLAFTADGNATDDNLGAMLWALDALVEVERHSPETLSQVVGTSKLFGESAAAAHDREMTRRKDVGNGH